MYDSTYDPSDNQGQMGPRMMGNQGYNYSSGSGMMGNMMMGNMMMGNMMALYYPESNSITQDEALRSMQSFLPDNTSRTRKSRISWLSAATTMLF